MRLRVCRVGGRDYPHQPLLIDCQTNVFDNSFLECANLYYCYQQAILSHLVVHHSAEFLLSLLYLHFIMYPVHLNLCRLIMFMISIYIDRFLSQLFFSFTITVSLILECSESYCAFHHYFYNVFYPTVCRIQQIPEFHLNNLRRRNLDSS